MTAPLDPPSEHANIFPSLDTRLAHIEASLIAKEMPVHAAGVRDARARLAEVSAERDTARQYGEEMYRLSREVTCVWCGHQFESTLGEQREALHAHALTCEKHPLRQAEARAERLRAQAKPVVEFLMRVARYAPNVDSGTGLCTGRDQAIYDGDELLAALAESSSQEEPENG